MNLAARTCKTKSVGSLMLKLGREIKSVKMSVLQMYIFIYLSLSITSLIYEE